MGTQSCRNDKKPSINYKYNPHGGASFDLVDVTSDKDYPSSSHNNNKHPSKQPESTPSILSTADLISGASQLWNFATSSLPVLRHRTQKNDSSQKENTFYYPAEEGNIIGSISSTGQNVAVNLKTDTSVSPTIDVQKNLEPVCVAQKLSSFGSCRERKINNVPISCELRNIYGWMNDIHLSSPTYKVNSTDNIITKTDEKHMMKTSKGVMSLCSDYLLHPIEDHEDGDCNDSSIVPISSLQVDTNLKSLGSNSCSVEYQIEKDDDIKEDQESQLVNQENPTIQNFSLALAKQEHAFAGAFAGVFVSLCLHPMDTVKTVVQSCHTDQRSIQFIGKAIIHERGLSGLYRGIASNIISSAPISAIYTFSYESVKGALLPLFTKEYESLAHCVAGGCASVATSFVFTPSERIKQQMQVGSHYQSCWNALLTIVGKGGLPSLYNGWGAVLCRNVPHSIIKFYTYESLKNMMFASHQPHAQPTTVSTLLCGGVAGSTAALFTTPFDVVKTRLQTQVPGSVNRYHGVFNTLKDISKHEGLKGLYRGLTPRLAMYMTQGALFFASYESFKRLFSTQLEPSLKGL